MITAKKGNKWKIQRQFFHVLALISVLGGKYVHYINVIGGKFSTYYPVSLIGFNNMFDWNWFFSSLSQSSAAIVGIFGAFIITKILSNQSEYSQKDSQLKKQLNHCQQLKEDANSLEFEWYAKLINEEAIEKLKTLWENNETESPDKLYDRLSFSIFSPRDKCISLIKHNLSVWDEKRKKEAEKSLTNKRLGLNSVFSTASPLDYKPPIISSMRIDEELEKERASIYSVLRDIRINIRTLNHFLDSIRNNPESSPQITYTLLLVIVLFFSGVIYPLSFLPVDTTKNIHFSLYSFFPLLFSFRGILLSIIELVWKNWTAI